jgi:hypothetical protein
MTDELPELPRPVQNLIDEGFRRHIERKIARDAAQAKKARDEKAFLTKLVALTLDLLPEAIRPYTQFLRLVDPSMGNYVHHDAEFLIAIPGAARIILRVETVKQWLENGPKADELQSVNLFDDARYGTEGFPFKIINYSAYFDEYDGIYVIGDIEIGNTRNLEDALYFAYNTGDNKAAVIREMQEKQENFDARREFTTTPTVEERITYLLRELLSELNVDTSVHA